jgi:uncharacterized membrane protein YqjE
MAHPLPPQEPDPSAAGPAQARRAPPDTRPDASPDATPGAGTAQEDAHAPLLQTLRAVLMDLPGLVSDRVRLLALELQRAGLALAQIVALVVAAAILASTAWLSLWAGIAVGLRQAGLSWGWALGIVIVINLGTAAWALRRARKLARWLALPATLRHLTAAAPAPSTAPPPAAANEPHGHPRDQHPAAA